MFCLEIAVAVAVDKVQHNSSQSIPKPINTLSHAITMTTINEDNKRNNLTNGIGKEHIATFRESITTTSILTDPTNYKKQISKNVLRCKLNKLRHLVLQELISPQYLEDLFPQIISLFDPQIVHYNGGIGNVPQWKISCYLEVMDGGVPTAMPNTKMKEICNDLLDTCNELFQYWYYQQHACNKKFTTLKNFKVKRIMTFITRYTPSPGENALLKHVDGAGKVDGSIVVALPLEEPKDVNSFYGHGGGLTFWDGKQKKDDGSIQEIFYDTRAGDVAFIDRAVWHQANPITRGTRWALVTFYKIIQTDDH